MTAAMDRRVDRAAATMWLDEVVEWRAFYAGDRRRHANPTVDACRQATVDVYGVDPTTDGVPRGVMPRRGGWT